MLIVGRCGRAVQLTLSVSCRQNVRFQPLLLAQRCSFVTSQQQRQRADPSNDSETTSRTSQLAKIPLLKSILSPAARQRSAAETERFPGWTTAYRFPHITFLRLLCRIKIYQTAVTAVLVPATFYSMSIGQTTPATCGMVTGFCAVTTITFVVFGELWRKVVGFVYLSPDKNQVIFSHLTFFGERKDVVADLSDIIPPAETTENPGDILWKIKFYSSPRYYLISTRYGQIRRPAAFAHIFGDTS